MSKPVQTPSTAEIDGGPLESLSSVYGEIKKGLISAPHRPAIISTRQSAAHFEHVVPRDEIFSASQPSYGCLAWSYQQLHRAAMMLATGLMANGVQPESTVVILMSNGAEYALLLWTCVMMRLTYVCFDPSAAKDGGTAELREMMERRDTAAIFFPDATLHDELAKLFIPRSHLPNRLLLVCIGGEEDAPCTTGCKTMSDLMADVSSHVMDEEALCREAEKDNPDRIHWILFTSGTSGRPKGCPLRVGGMTHMLASQAWLINEDNCRLALQQAHNSCGIAPAQTLQTWRQGGTVVMTGRGFDAADAADVMIRLGTTFLVLTPPMVHAVDRELERRGGHASARSVRTVQVGGDAVTKDIVTRCAAMFPNAEVCVNHGMTEGGGSFRWPFFGTEIRDLPFFGGVCPIGVVAPGARVRIWDSDLGQVSTRGRHGELHLCCGSIIPHYYNRVSGSSFYFDETGSWFKTGDVAMMDANGLVFILGRAKDIIRRRGGATTMPAPIEGCIQEFTGAQTVAVPIPREGGGDAAVIVLDRWTDRTKFDIQKHVLLQLGPDYVPDNVLTLGELGLSRFPVNPTFKIMKPKITMAVLAWLGNGTL